MNKTIDMQFMRYINLFRSYTKISTSDCFNYNNTIYFAVPKSQMSLALGRNGENIKRLVEVLRKKIRVKPRRVIKMPEIEYFNICIISNFKFN